MLTVADLANVSEDTVRRAVKRVHAGLSPRSGRSDKGTFRRPLPPQVLQRLSELQRPARADKGQSRNLAEEQEEMLTQIVANNEFAQLLKSKLETFANTLEGREQTIFRERWLSEEPLTLQELGDRYNVSRERARQLEKRVLDRLKKYLEAELGSAVDIAALTRE